MKDLPPTFLAFFENDVTKHMIPNTIHKSKLLRIDCVSKHNRRLKLLKIRKVNAIIKSDFLYP